MSSKLLILEDSYEDQKLYYKILSSQFQIKCAGNIKEFVEHAPTFNPHLVILDLELPDGDGVSAFLKLNELNALKLVPKIFVSARKSIDDIVRCLNLGADDYITKPFDPTELLARINTKIRKSQEHVHGSTQVHKGAILVDLKTNQAYKFVNNEKQLVDLTSKEFKLLALLVQSEGQAFAREDILERIWGESVKVTHRTIDSHLSTLRKKFEPHGDYFKTVFGYGYKFEVTKL